jgi:hypothetical protein
MARLKARHCKTESKLRRAAHFVQNLALRTDQLDLQSHLSGGVGGTT